MATKTSSFSPPDSGPIRSLAGMTAYTLLRVVVGVIMVAHGVKKVTRVSAFEDTVADRLGPGGVGGAGAEQDLTPELLRTLPQTVQDAFADAVTNGLHVVAIGGAIVGVLTFAVAWLIREVPLRDTNAEDADAAPDPLPDTAPA